MNQNLLFEFLNSNYKDVVKSDHILTERDLAVSIVTLNPNNPTVLIAAKRLLWLAAKLEETQSTNKKPSTLEEQRNRDIDFANRLLNQFGFRGEVRYSYAHSSYGVRYIVSDHNNRDVEIAETIECVVAKAIVGAPSVS